jgi:hypothetical protein
LLLNPRVALLRSWRLAYIGVLLTAILFLGFAGFFPAFVGCGFSNEVLRNDHTAKVVGDVVNGANFASE